jgi:hypothetical protein
MSRRKLGLVVLFCLIVVAAAVAAIQIEQRILRARAELLLSDIRSLELRKSNWSDAQKILARWGAWGHYDGSCNSQRCDYWFQLGDFFYTHQRFVPNAPWARRAYDFLGGRIGLIRANVLVMDGLVWGKGFRLYVEVTPEGGPNPAFAGNGYGLIGYSESVSRFAAGFESPLLELHPHYLVGTPSGCTGCLAVYARFTPFADPTDVNRLMDFNLACLTTRKPCREKGDIMPSAWRQYLAEAKTSSPGGTHPRPCAVPLQWQARDSDNAVIVEVVSKRTEKGTETFQVSTVRLLKRLKAASFWEIGTARDIRVFPGDVSLTRTDLPEDVSSGSTFIMLFQHARYAGPTGPEVWLQRCGAVPLNDANLKAVRSGIDQDFISALRPE